jgi:transketolase C-terminal domain/subunit
MRKTLSEFIKKDDYFLHADMWNTNRFPICDDENVINCGLGESNLLNVAGGISSQKNTVYIYGVCGFIIHRFEQLKFSCKHFGTKSGKIVIANAGKVGYENLGIGHELNDDLDIMKILDIKTYTPNNIEDLVNDLEEIEDAENGIFYIQLGKDEE